MALSVKSGSYTGDGGVSKATTGVGFQPTFLLIKGGSNVAQVSHANMTGAEDITGSVPSITRVISLDADGFTVGVSGTTNTNGTTYYYLALAGSGDIATGTYAGDATGPRAITAPGFQPTLVMIWDDLGDTGGFRTSDMATDSFLDYGGATGVLTDRFLSLDATGFTVSFRNEVNGTGRNYYWVAVKDATNLFNTLTYTGNGSDDRTLTGMGFQPDFALTNNGTTATSAALRFKDETGDNSFQANATGEAANKIQAFTSDGFQVGTHGSVNTNTNVYYAIGFKEPGAAPAAATGSTLMTMGVG